MNKPSLQRLGLYQLLALGMLAVSVTILALAAASTQVALCAFKKDLDRRIEINQQLLDQQHDPVIRAYGLRIPRAVLESTVNGQEATRKGLHRVWFC